MELPAVRVAGLAVPASAMLGEAACRLLVPSLFRPTISRDAGWAMRREIAANLEPADDDPVD